MENFPANLVTISAAARRLGVSATALRAWHQAGIIPAVRTPGGHRRFDLEVIRNIIFSEEGAPHVQP